MQIVKKYTSIFVLVAMSTFITQCGTAQKDTNKMIENPPFTIIEATHQDWIAGVQGGGAGTTVMIKFGSIEDDVAITNFYFGNFKASAKVLPVNALTYQANVLNNTNSDRNMDIDPKKEVNKLPNPKTQFELEEGTAIIEYTFKGKIFFYKVTDMIEKPMLAYPSANPNGNGRGN